MVGELAGSVVRSIDTGNVYRVVADAPQSIILTLLSGKGKQITIKREHFNRAFMEVRAGE